MYRILFLSLMFLFLAGCSAKKSDVKIEITRSFVGTNSSFNGGLIVHGKNKSTGKEFSLSLSAQTSASVALDFGIWDIRAVGWENVSGEAFQGTPFCAAETVDFKSDGQRAALQVTNDKCNDQRFAGSAYMASSSVAAGTNTVVSTGTYTGTTATTNFRPIPIYVCGALYDPAAPSQLITSAHTKFNHNLCDTYPSDENSSFFGMKISYSNMAPDGTITEGLSSGCIGGTRTLKGNPIFASALSLPTKIPLSIKFYKTASCDDSTMVRKYTFPQGMEHSLPRAALKFDSVLGVITNTLPTSPAMFLASNLSDRGTTPYGTEMPRFSCGSGPCFQLPLKDTSDFYLSNGDNVIRITNTNHVCGEVSLASTGNINMYGCSGDPSGLILMLNVQVPTSPSDVTITLSSTNSSQSPESYTVTVDNGFRIFKDLKDLFGAPAPVTDDISDSMLNHNMQSENHAIMDDIADILSPAKLGGIFWDQVCTTTPLPSPIKRSTSFFEDGSLQTLEAILTNPPASAVPGFVANKDNPQSPALSGVFHRRFIVRKLVNSVTGFKTFLTMDIACDGVESLTAVTASSIVQSGRMEEIHFENNAHEQRIEKTLTFWNTANVINSRFERYRLEFNTNTNYGTTYERRQTSFIRGEKFPNNGNSNSDYKVTMLDYHYDSYSGDHLRHRDVNVSGTEINVTEDNFHQNTSTPGIIFTDDKDLKEKKKIRYGADIEQLKNHSSGRFLSSKLMVDGNGGYNGIIQTNFNGSYQTITTAISGPQGIASDISEDGSKGIVVFFGDSVKTYVFDGSQVISELATFDSNTFNGFQALIHNNGDLLILMKSQTTLYFNIGHGSSGNLPTTIPAQNILTNQNYFDVSATTKGTNDFWFFSNRSDQSGSSVIHNINYCRIFKNTAGVWSGCTLDNLNSTSTTSSTYEISASFKPSTGEVVVSFIEINLTATDPAMSRVAEHTFKTRSGQTAIVWTHGSTTDFSNSHFNSYGFSMASLNPAANPSPFDIPIPYAAPTVPSFQMNYQSLQPELMNQNVFSPMSTFESLGGNL